MTLDELEAELAEIEALPFQLTKVLPPLEIKIRPPRAKRALHLHPQVEEISMHLDPADKERFRGLVLRLLALLTEGDLPDGNT